MAATEKSQFAGSVRYPPAHPSRWAGSGLYGVWFGPARLSIEGDGFVMRPMRPWGWWMPTVRGRFSDLTMVWRTRRGIELVAPGDTSIDGLRFRPQARLSELLALLKGREIPIEPMPWPEQARRSLQAYLISQRPGWIWRDRGRLAFVETAVWLMISFGLMVTVLYLAGASDRVRNLILIWCGLLVVIAVWGGVAGHRRHKRLERGSAKRIV